MYAGTFLNQPRWVSERVLGAVPWFFIVSTTCCAKLFISESMIYVFTCALAPI